MDRARRALCYRLDSEPHANSIEHLQHRGELRRRVLPPIEARARHAGLARNLRHVVGARDVLDGAQNEFVVAGLKGFREVVRDHFRIVEMPSGIEWLQLDHGYLPSSLASCCALAMSRFCECLSPA